VLQENQGFEQVVIHLARYGIGMKTAQKIYQQYKDEAIETLYEDPYQFVFDIDGFGFRTADNIARQNGLTGTHPNWIGAVCFDVDRMHSTSGECCSRTRVDCAKLYKFN